MRKVLERKWIVVPLVIALGIGAYYLPPINSRLSWRVDNLRGAIKHFFNPPEQAVFQPTQQAAIAAIVSATMQAYNAAQTASPTPARPGPTLIPTITPAPLPASVDLPGVVYVDQHGRWNYCGPANLTMALNFWGWTGDRDDVARVVKPVSSNLSKSFIERGLPDKNVMPYELIDFVNENTEFRALMRYGGSTDLLKRLIAAGFPVVVEKGYYEADYRHKIDWLGHYLFTTGYDNERGGFIVQDAWLEPGKNLLSEYDAYLDGWRSFNYLFMVVYPADREAEVMSLLGPWTDETWAQQHALEIANRETQSLSGNDLYYAWFNKGTSHVSLQEYADAAAAYDQAFAIYSDWNEETFHRPYRMMWYQTGPYFAYFYTARYQDVINLANITLDSVGDGPTLEESLLWRGRAEYMLGNTQAAIDDYRAALAVHIDWVPAVEALADLGLTP
jgi:tetratricopeptide (TPR) repeat protein